MDHVAGMIAAALYPTPLGAWLVPDLDQRGKVLAAVTKIWIEHAMFYGDIYLSADGGITAAAVCFHRYRPLPPPANYPTRLADAAGPHTNQFAALDNIIANNQPTEAHYHLAYLAVHPHHQRSRLGTALMTHLRSQLDGIELPSWTMTIPDGLRLLARSGYTAQPAITLANGPALHPMSHDIPHRDGSTTSTTHYRQAPQG
ncbi:GNAT family N-acetyltransferase [Micromonospora fiedleri]|nr:GNAT family N-acetyltransferase [Micromonospora fiedleri]